MSAAEIPLEVVKATLNKGDSRTLGLLLNTAKTIFSEDLFSKAIYNALPTYKMHALFKARAAAYGLGFLYSKADQIVGRSESLMVVVPSAVNFHQLYIHICCASSIDSKRNSYDHLLMKQYLEGSSIAPFVRFLGNACQNSYALSRCGKACNLYPVLV